MKIKLLVVLCSVLIWPTLSGAAEVENADPWEGWNRMVFAFNDGLDEVILYPVAQGYRFITPDFVENGISRMFENFNEVRNLVNDLLQGKIRQAGNDTSRFLVNSTLGLVGFFDIAQSMWLEKSDREDLGQTLSVWGVGQGPYLMLPLIGPSTLRDAPGIAVDSFFNPAVAHIEDAPTRNSIIGFSAVVLRADLMDAEDLLQGDEYTIIRDAYLQRRQHLIADGEVEDDFGDFDNY